MKKATVILSGILVSTFIVSGCMKAEQKNNSSDYKEFNYSSSSCSNYVFNTLTDSDQITGAWSYNSTTGKMILIFDFDAMGGSDPEAYEYSLIKLNNNKLYLYDLDYDEYLRLEK